MLLFYSRSNGQVIQNLKYSVCLSLSIIYSMFYPIIPSLSHHYPIISHIFSRKIPKLSSGTSRVLLWNRPWRTGAKRVVQPAIGTWRFKIYVATWHEWDTSHVLYMYIIYILYIYIYVCVCICICKCMHTYWVCINLYIYMYMDMYMYMYMDMYMCMYMYMYIYVYVYVYVCMYVYVILYICVCVCLFSSIHVCLRIIHV